MSALRSKIRMFLHPRRLLSAVTLVMYVVTSVGIPLNLTGASPQSCRCRQELHSSNQCCCHKRTGTAALQSVRICCRSNRNSGNNLTIDTDSLCCSSKNELSVEQIEQLSVTELDLDVDSKPASRSCCSKKRAARNETQREELALHACSCGGDIVFGLLLNPEPRNLQVTSKLTMSRVDVASTPGDADRPAEPYLLLETPPPKDRQERLLLS